MKIRARILLASGFYRYGGTLGLLLLGVYVQPWLVLASLVWLTGSRRIIRQWLLPPLFPAVRCYGKKCRRRVSLYQRWRCNADQWTDSTTRHALAVYSDQGHEVRSFDCPHCDTTISLQKGDRELYKRWKQVDVVSASSGKERPQFGLQLGYDRQSFNGLLVRLWRRLRGHAIDDPVILSNEVLSRHGTIFGATGQGKSTLIINLARQVFENGDGATFLDPAGDLSRDLIAQVPPDRVKDVLYINVADQKFPFPFNIFHAADSNERNLLPDELIGIFKNLYARSWGETISNQLRMAIRAVLEVGGSLQDVYDLLTSPEKRQRLIRKLKDKELRQYWQETYPSIGYASRLSLIQKLEPIVKHPFLGAILCSRECAFKADEVIAQRKILIVNLSTGTRADYTTEILGTFIVNKMVAAAYRQGSIEEASKRIRHVFFIDEFQNFMHRASGWDRNLSELRKFKLCLILVTQFVEQVKEDIRAAIFGNVGFLVAFRVGHKDSGILSNEFEGASKRDLLDLERGECLIRVGTHPMSVRTILPPEPTHDPANEIIDRMRQLIIELRSNEPNFRNPERETVELTKDVVEAASDAIEEEIDLAETNKQVVLAEFA